MIQIDMEMPKDCYHCPCHKHWDVNNYICGITGDTANYLGFRRDFCPLKEVSSEPILDKVKQAREKIDEMSRYTSVTGVTQYKQLNREDVLEILDELIESEG